MGMSNRDSNTPRAFPIISEPVLSRYCSGYKVRDPLTGQALYFRDEQRANAYAARLEIAAATMDL